MSSKTLICIVGATASGKTGIAIKIAQYLNTEIISADSRQFYKELSIGTAKPSDQELASVPHHFINNKSITEIYSAGDFETDALEKIESLFKSHNTVVLVGGSGMYIDAVTKGFDPFPTYDAAIREGIVKDYSEKGISYLQSALKRLDPVYYEQVDIQNPQRLMRALEVIQGSGKPFSDFTLKKERTRNFNIVTIGLHWEREELYNRINDRVDTMIEQGLEEEARLYANLRNNYALKSVGYTEFLDYFDGKQDITTTISLIKQHTRNYAKRQLTWFRRNVNTTWINATDEKAIFAFIINLHL